MYNTALIITLVHRIGSHDFLSDRLIGGGLVESWQGHTYHSMTPKEGNLTKLIILAVFHAFSSKFQKFPKCMALP